MLFTTGGTQITRAPHRADHKQALRLLGNRRAAAVRLEINQIINEMTPDTETGRRTFSSSYIGAQIEPWPYPLASLYDIALKIEGDEATGRDIYDRAEFILALFVWECLMRRTEQWVVSEHNVNRTDPDRSITNTVYREQGPDETSTNHRQRKRE